MTNLKWLASLSREEASETMRAYCPFHESSTCNKKECPFFEEGRSSCVTMSYPTDRFIDWLLEEREEHDAEH